MGFGSHNTPYVHSRWGGRSKSRSNSPVNNLDNINIKQSNKIYLFVNYYDKDDAKILGAKWDKDVKKWYTNSNNKDLIKKYGQIKLKTFLNIPFKDKEDAKKLGAKWNNNNKQWYAPNNEKELIERWGNNDI